MTKRRGKKTKIAAAASLILVLAIAATGTLAYLTAQQDGDEAVVNTFVAAELIDNSEPDPDNPPDVPDNPYDPDNPDDDDEDNPDEPDNPDDDDEDNPDEPDNPDDGDDDEDNPSIQNGLKLLETKTVLINGEYVALEYGEYGYSSSGYVIKVDGTWYIYNSSCNTITEKTVDASDVTLISTSTLTNDYTMLVPGTTVPKDPTASVNICDGMSAYIYIKVTDTSDYITYEISSDWEKVDALSSGTEAIYIYVGDAADGYIVTGDSSYELQSVSILAGNVFYVSEELEDGGIDLGDLTFELYVCQASGFGGDYVTAYTTCFGE